MSIDYNLLAKKAIEARAFSYAPYSSFAVGAALLTKSGKIYTGCNIENAAFSPTNCAERTAFFKAVSEGERDFLAIAIAGGKKTIISPQKLALTAPCGVCRQIMLEFCEKTFEIILVEDEKNFKIYTLNELIPHSFSKKSLEQD